jgi:hypothetical protein
MAQCQSSVEENPKMKRIQSLVLGLVLAISSTVSFAQSSEVKGAGKDMKEAGKATGRAAKKTGKAVVKGTKKGVNKTAEVTEKGAEKLKDKTNP